MFRYMLGKQAYVLEHIQRLETCFMCLVFYRSRTERQNLQTPHSILS